VFFLPHILETDSESRHLPFSFSIGAARGLAQPTFGATGGRIHHVGISGGSLEDAETIHLFRRIIR
jgi:hypothetical protein